LRPTDGVGLVDIRHGHDLPECGQLVHGELQGLDPIAETRADRQRDPHRVIRTMTSSKTSVTGAYGLCTVTVTWSTPGKAFTRCAMLSARASINWNGGPVMIAATSVATAP